MKYITTVKIPALKGSKLIKYSNLFSWIDLDFVNWNASEKGIKTKAQNLDVLEIDKDGTFKDFFNKNQALTQEQILYFIKNHKDKLTVDGFGTFFLFKSGDNFFVASVLFSSDDELYVSVSGFESDGVWDAEGRHRVVVPQLDETKPLKNFDPLKISFEYDGVKYKIVKN